MSTTKTKPIEKKQELDDLHVAGEIHTLANLIYQGLVETRPWLAGAWNPSVFSEPTCWPPMSAGTTGEADLWSAPEPWTR